MSQPKRLRIKVNHDLFVIGQRSSIPLSPDRLNLTAYYSTKPRQQISTVTVLVEDVPVGAYDSERFILDKCYVGAWPYPPEHRIAEAFAKCARELCS